MKNYKLKDERAKRRLTQSDMARMLGLKALASYTMKENGQRKFTTDEIKIIIKEFKLTPEETTDIFLKY